MFVGGLVGMGVGRSDAMNLDWGEGSNVRWLVVGRDAKAQVTFSLTPRTSLKKRHIET